jgi:hypothetical protein
MPVANMFLRPYASEHGPVTRLRRAKTMKYTVSVVLMSGVVMERFVPMTGIAGRYRLAPILMTELAVMASRAIKVKFMVMFFILFTCFFEEILEWIST